MGKVKMWRLWLVSLRLRREQGRHGRQSQSLHQRRWLLLLLLLLMMMLMVLVCRVTGLLDRLLVARQWTSLGLLDTRGLQVHVGIAHSLPVQLLLGPDHPPEADRQLTLAALGVLRPQDGRVELRGHLLPVAGGQEVREGRHLGVLKSQESERPLKLLEHALVLLSTLSQVLCGKLQRLLHLLQSDQLDEVLLLQVEQEVPVIIQQLRMELINQGDGVQDVARLDTVADPDSVVEEAQILARTHPCLLLEPLSRVLKTPRDQVIHDQLVHRGSGNPHIIDLLHPLLLDAGLLSPERQRGMTGPLPFPLETVHTVAENGKAVDFLGE